jgi:hypothetical protein
MEPSPADVIIEHDVPEVAGERPALTRDHRVHIELDVQVSRLLVDVVQVQREIVRDLMSHAPRELIVRGGVHARLH